MAVVSSHGNAESVAAWFETFFSDLQDPYKKFLREKVLLEHFRLPVCNDVLSKKYIVKLIKELNGLLRKMGQTKRGRADRSDFCELTKAKKAEYAAYSEKTKDALRICLTKLQFMRMDDEKSDELYSVEKMYLNYNEKSFFQPALMKDDEWEPLTSYRNFVAAFLAVPLRDNKTSVAQGDGLMFKRQVMTVAGSLHNGSYVASGGHVTGGGQNDTVDRREWICECEAEFIQKPRPMRWSEFAKLFASGSDSDSNSDSSDGSDRSRSGKRPRLSLDSIQSLPLSGQEIAEDVRFLKPILVEMLGLSGLCSVPVLEARKAATLACVDSLPDSPENVTDFEVVSD